MRVGKPDRKKNKVSKVYFVSVIETEQNISGVDGSEKMSFDLFISLWFDLFFRVLETFLQHVFFLFLNRPHFFAFENETISLGRVSLGE
jgi:hypothetical protein